MSYIPPTKYKGNDIIARFALNNGLKCSDFVNIRVWFISDTGFCLAKFSMNELEGHDHENFQVTSDENGQWEVWILKTVTAEGVCDKYRVYVDTCKVAGAPWSREKTSTIDEYLFELKENPLA